LSRREKEIFFPFFDTTNENFFYICRYKWNVTEGELRMFMSYLQAMRAFLTRHSVRELAKIRERFWNFVQLDNDCGQHSGEVAIAMFSRIE